MTENYALLRIRRCNDDTPCTGADSVAGGGRAGVANDTGEFWQVWTPDGTWYVFGVTRDSAQLFLVASNTAIGTPAYAGRIPSQVASAWQLSAVYARHRDDPATGRTSATYRYHELESPLHSDQLSSVSASTNANGTVVGRQLFEPFGAVRAEFGQVNGSWGWATHRKSERLG